ncbi:glycosyltransferase family 39 protein [Paractinoplanes brasiliensis]|uniref:Mannosyltransferase n=1 Tax=Paractinoplanes brasiliensis TaxID=52695 RepID=A0A4R6K1P2_9ACTN|nr:glycosyltransferase family 39 protein [Actinoplanes brasiliensis]TDO42031.1 mannosyltransferase [Actinoplanes brasiliensis]GID33092.1 membrane protein [Actinoplanes brasiliensis]
MSQLERPPLVVPDATERPPVRQSLPALTAPVGAALLTAIVALIGAGTPGLWADELATRSAVGRSWAEMFRIFEVQDVTMAPYYVLMHAWTTVAGTSELALRLPSVLAIAAAAGCTAMLAERLFGQRAGVVAALLFAFVPVTTRTAQEARPYAIAVLFAVLATYLLLRVTRERSRAAWAGYAVALALAGCFHLMTLLILIAHLLLVRRGDRALRVRWALSAGAAIAVTAPLAVAGAGQTAQVDWLAEISVRDVGGFLDTLGGGVTAGAVLIGLAVWGWFRGGEWRGPLIAWALAPAAVLMLVTVVGPNLWHPRYVLFSFPAFVIAAARPLASVRAVLGGVLVAVVLLAGLPAHLAARSGGGHLGFDGDRMRQVFEREYRSGDAVVFVDSDEWSPREALRYYVPERIRPRDVLATGSYDARRPYQVVERTDPAALSAAGRIWVVRWQWGDADPLKSMEPWKTQVLRGEYQERGRWDTGALRLIRYDRG